MIAIAWFQWILLWHQILNYCWWGNCIIPYLNSNNHDWIIWSLGISRRNWNWGKNKQMHFDCLLLVGYKCTSLSHWLGIVIDVPYFVWMVCLIRDLSNHRPNKFYQDISMFIDMSEYMWYPIRPNCRQLMRTRCCILVNKS